MNEQEMMTVVVVEPMKKPYVTSIGKELEDMQTIVGGMIQEIMPFDDQVAIICNEEGKIQKQELNRALYDADGEMYDIITGTFFICEAPFDSDQFESLSPELQEKYMEKYQYPEQFYRAEDGIRAFPFTPKQTNHER